MKRSTWLHTLALPLVLTAAACSGGGGGSGSSGTGSIAFEVTDAPIDPTLVARAVIEVDAVRVHRDADGDSGFLTVYEGSPVVFDLMELRNGLTQGFNSAALPVGSYGQVRLHVTDALLELVDGRVFSTQDDTIRLTSQGTSGFKVFLSPAVVVHENVVTRVLLDFELTKTFSPVPANNLAQASFFHLHPNVRAAVLQETGELRGTVRTTDTLGADVPATGAVVYVLAPGETDPALAMATTMTDANGQAAILGVPTGTYDVLATQDGRTGRADGLTVSVGNVTSFEIVLQ